MSTSLISFASKLVVLKNDKPAVSTALVKGAEASYGDEILQLAWDVTQALHAYIDQGVTWDKVLDLKTEHPVFLLKMGGKDFTLTIPEHPLTIEGGSKKRELPSPENLPEGLSDTTHCQFSLNRSYAAKG